MSSLSRRAAIGAGLASLLAAASEGEVRRLFGLGGLPLGINLYMLDSVYRSDIDGALETVARIGYREIETNPELYSAERISAALSRHGLRCPNLQSQAATVTVQARGFILSMLSIYFVFMKLSDKVNQRLLFGVSAVMQVAGMALLALFPLLLPLALIHVFLMQVGGGFGAQSFFQLWSAELFPTLVRSTARGVTFAIVRIGLGCWSFFVPVLTSTGISTLAWILTGFPVASGLVGLIWSPRNEGKSLDQLEEERRAPAHA